MTWIKKSSKKRKKTLMHNAHEITWKKHKNIQWINELKMTKWFDEFWNNLNQLNVSNVNFESTINDLKRISIVWNLLLTNLCWFEAIKNNDFDYLTKRFEIDFKRRNQSNTFFDEIRNFFKKKSFTRFQN